MDWSGLIKQQFATIRAPETREDAPHQIAHVFTNSSALEMRELPSCPSGPRKGKWLSLTTKEKGPRISEMETDECDFSFSIQDVDGVTEGEGGRKVRDPQREDCGPSQLSFLPLHDAFSLFISLSVSARVSESLSI